MYTPDAVVNGVNYTQIMNAFAISNADRTGYQFKIESPLTDLSAPTTKRDIVAVPSSSFIYDYTLKNPNVTTWGITFNQSADTSRVNIQYQVWYNATNIANGSDIFGRDLIAFVRGMDEAISKIRSHLLSDIKVN